MSHLRQCTLLNTHLRARSVDKVTRTKVPGHGQTVTPSRCRKVRGHSQMMTLQKSSLVRNTDLMTLHPPSLAPFFRPLLQHPQYTSSGDAQYNKTILTARERPMHITLLTNLNLTVGHDVSLSTKCKCV